MPDLSVFQWTLLVFTAFSVGLAKTGVPGLGIMIVPVMVLAVGDARHSAGWLLPMLCTADLFAVVYYRRHAAAGKLFSLAPWVLGGMAIGAAALSLDEKILRPAIGVILLLMLIAHLWRRYRKTNENVAPHPAAYGVSAGFATTVANAAGPVMNLYLLSRRLPKEEFVATGAWFFFVINLSKIPIYLWHGLITPASLRVDLSMVPVILVGSLAGRWIVHRIPQRVFEVLVTALTAVSTLLLFR